MQIKEGAPITANHPSSHKGNHAAPHCVLPCSHYHHTITKPILIASNSYPILTIFITTMPKDNYGQSYNYKSSGTNSSGNHYCARDYGSSASNSNSYHYSNSNGSYYYSNSDGSSYYNTGKGSSSYTPPSGGSSGQSSGSSTGKKWGIFSSWKMGLTVVKERNGCFCGLILTYVESFVAFCRGRVLSDWIKCL